MDIFFLKTLYCNFILQCAEKIFEIKQKLINELEASGVIKRHRKVRSAEDLIDAILLMITENLSLRRLSEVMAIRHNIFMSDTAWEKQILKCADVFKKAAESVSSLGITDNDVRHGGWERHVHETPLLVLS